MESILRSVSYLAGDDRLVMEHLVGGVLRHDQHVLIQVLDVNVEPSEDVRRAALEQLARIAGEGRAHAAALGVSPETADKIIDTAMSDILGRATRGRRQLEETPHSL